MQMQQCKPEKTKVVHFPSDKINKIVETSLMRYCIRGVEMLNELHVLEITDPMKTEYAVKFL